MSYIFLDESGDLGFDFTKTKTSRYFAITFLFATDKKPLDRLVKKTFASLSKQQVRTHRGTLHAYKEPPAIRRKLLTGLATKDVRILTIYLNKRKVRATLRDQKHILYNFVTNILLDRLLTNRLIPINEKITLIASKRETKKLLNENFQTYLRQQASRNHRLDLEILIKTSGEEKALQVADMASWAIYRKWEHGDSSYCDAIQEKIIEERPLFP